MAHGTTGDSMWVVASSGTDHARRPSLSGACKVVFQVHPILPTRSGCIEIPWPGPMDLPATRLVVRELRESKMTPLYLKACGGRG